MKKTKDRITSMLNAITSSGTSGGENVGEPSKNRSESEQSNHAGSRQQANPPRSRLKSFRERLQKQMAAVAYAEAGEFEAATELVGPSVRSKTVLLVIEGESPHTEPFAYALNLCKRTNSELDILQVIEQSRKDGDSELLSHKMTEGSRNIVGLVRQLEADGIPFKVTIRLGDVTEKLFNYARRHKDVAMVIFDTPRRGKGADKVQAFARILENISQQLSIPLVTVHQKQALAMR